MTLRITKQLNQGFTLIELLLYVSIVSVVLLAISLFISSLLESRVKNQTIAEVDGQGLHVMQIITQSLRNAVAINSPALGVSAASLSINTVVAGNNPTIFDVSVDALRMSEGGGAPVLLTNARVIASALNFTNLSRPGTRGTVRITFTLTHSNPAGRQEYSYSKSFISSATLR